MVYCIVSFKSDRVEFNFDTTAAGKDFTLTTLTLLALLLLLAFKFWIIYFLKIQLSAIKKTATWQPNSMGLYVHVICNWLNELSYVLCASAPRIFSLPSRSLWLPHKKTCERALHHALTYMHKSSCHELISWHLDRSPHHKRTIIEADHYRRPHSDYLSMTQRFLRQLSQCMKELLGVVTCRFRGMT